MSYFNPGIALALRPVSFLVAQCAIALVVGWDGSTAYWPIAALVTNLVTIAFLVRVLQAEGVSYWSLFRLQRETLGRDLIWLLPVLLLALPAAYIPNIGLATALFGDPEIALAMLVQPLPMWVAILALGFPLTIIFAELPLYFGYVMPRLAAQTKTQWQAVVVPALFLSLQHIALPLVLDRRFALWRAVMFLPFALLVGLAIRWRPSLLAYLVVIHGIIDLGMVAMLFPFAS